MTVRAVVTVLAFAAILLGRSTGSAEAASELVTDPILARPQQFVQCIAVNASTRTISVRSEVGLEDGARAIVATCPSLEPGEICPSASMPSGLSTQYFYCAFQVKGTSAKNVRGAIVNITSGEQASAR